MIYTLKPDYSFNIQEYFPDIGNNKVAIFFSGGMESVLMSRIALDLYGKEKCVFVYCGSFSPKHPGKQYNVVHNVDHGAFLLDIEVNYVEFEYYYTDALDIKSGLRNLYKSLGVKYNTKYFMYGFTKMYFDLEVIAKLHNPSSKQIKDLLLSDPFMYREMIEEFHIHKTNFFIDNILCNINISPAVYDLVREDEQHDKMLLCPFRHIYKYQVLDLYYKMNLKDLMYNTLSCISEEVTNEHMHCGKCMNCQQRHDAHKILGIEDLTKYKHNVVSERTSRKVACT